MKSIIAASARIKLRYKIIFNLVKHVIPYKAYIMMILELISSTYDYMIVWPSSEIISCIISKFLKNIIKAFLIKQRSKIGIIAVTLEGQISLKGIW